MNVIHTSISNLHLFCHKLFHFKDRPVGLFLANHVHCVVLLSSSWCRLPFHFFSSDATNVFRSN